MTGEVVEYSGNVSWLSKQDNDVQIDYTTPLEGADNDGWLPAMETDGEPRVWDTDRIVEGYISSERLDTQQEVVPLEAFTVKTDATGEMPLIEWVAKNSELMWVHGHTAKGSLAVGRAIGYKIEKGRPKFRWGIKKGSPLIDDCWELMKQHGTAAGFSIGGAKVERECDENKCILHKLDVVEVSWTPNPANQDASVTHINKLAKGDDEEDDGLTEEEQLEKPCPWKKRASAIEASDLDGELKTELLGIIKAREPQSNAAVWKLPHDRQEEELDAFKPLKMKGSKKSQSSGDEHGPSVTTRKGENSMADKDESAPLEKWDAILAGQEKMQKSIDALVKALTKQEEDEKEPPKKDEEEEDKDAEKQDDEDDKKDEDEEPKKDEEKSIKKASDAELLGAVIERGLASKLQDLQKGGAARPTGTGQPLAKTDGDDSYARRLKGRIARAEKLQGAQ